SWLFQLCTGHFPLNVYLFRFKRTENAHCPACGHPNETPQHFILNCPAYAHERWPMIAGKSQKKEYAYLVGNAKNAVPLINFIQATRRFRKDNWIGGGQNGQEGDRRGLARANEEERQTRQGTSTRQQPKHTHHITHHTSPRLARPSKGSNQDTKRGAEDVGSLLSDHSRLGITKHSTSCHSDTLAPQLSTLDRKPSHSCRESGGEIQFRRRKHG
ncbi:hypothetical protein EI94DRAFT_1593125, partial [Lactarius quietus]